MRARTYAYISGTLNTRINMHIYIHHIYIYIYTHTHRTAHCSGVATRSPPSGSISAPLRTRYLRGCGCVCVCVCVCEAVAMDALYAHVCPKE